jgi:phosphoribosylanthranilate isomerase
MPSALLVDAHVPGMHGGTGQRAPWELLAGWRPPLPLILAGGLTPENVAEAIRLVRPYGVDIASGVEIAPGKKDGERMQRFLDAVREAELK